VATGDSNRAQQTTPEGGVVQLTPQSIWFGIMTQW